MNKKNVWILIGIIVVIGIIVWGSLNSKKKEIPSNQIIKVGVILPLTGPLAQYGEAVKNGIVLAEEKLNNKKINYVFEDSAYDSAKTITAFNKLKDFDKVDVIFNWGDPTSQAIAPLIKNNPFPLVAFSTIPAVGQMSPYIVRAFDSSKDFADATWSYLRSKNLKNIGIIKTENPYFNGIVDELTKSKKVDEQITVVDNYLSPSDKDFKTSIVKINSGKEYDTIGVFLLSGQINQFYKQASVLGMKIPTFGTDQFENQNEINAAGDAMNGAVYVNYDVSDNFKTDYKNRFNSDSLLAFAGLAYDTVEMLNNVKNNDKDSIINTFKMVKNYPGVIGERNFVEISGDQYLFAPYHVKVIENGVIKLIK